jgi:hypothetical protein
VDSLNLSSVPLSGTEKSVFHDNLLELGLDDNVWVVYERFLQTGSEYSKPLIIRVYKNDELFACMFLIECKDYGPTLSKLQIVKYIARSLAIPVHIWMKAGIAAEICANPVFINKKIGSDYELGDVLNLLRERFLLLFIHDLAWNASLHPRSVIRKLGEE